MRGVMPHKVSLLQACEEALNILNSDEFKVLYEPSPHAGKNAHHDKDKLEYKRLFQAMGENLTHLLQKYYNIIYNLEALNLEDDVTTYIKNARVLQQQIAEFLNDLNGQMRYLNSTKKEKLPSEVRSTLSTKLGIANANIRALEDYAINCLNIFKTLDFNGQISKLENDVQALNKAYVRTKKERAQHQTKAVFNLHKKGDETKLDFQPFEERYQRLKEEAKTKEKKYKDKSARYNAKTITAWLCGALIVTLPITIPLTIYYAIKAEKNREKYLTEYNRSLKLDSVKEGITAAKSILQKNKSFASISEPELNQQRNALRQAVSDLSLRVEADIQRRRGKPKKANP